MKEISFDKYNKKGAGFHWQQVGHNPLKKNVFGFNLFNTSAGKWRYYALQTAVIKKSA